ncbi:MAG: DUF547 domain-containing protein [Croceitalea sp.]|nr:DUF547 domain-containing protein [Croceitalea sp.]MBT8237953.1 DUF547 domain-containing protein [Croceitalea sp.]NNL09817.1 DUF547 domain-containing protein [Croceitalea sp.]NNM17064.1 DUF547 domain-containing protein [Croceitalea sp.]
MKVKLVILFFSAFVQYGAAQSTELFFAKANTFFATYVKDGLVDYQSIIAKPKALNELLAVGQDISVSQDKEREFQAFWINAYNLLVIKGVVDAYPISSPLDQAGFFDKALRNFGGKQLTINDIENKLLRANYPDEARFHFVLVCAGLGCPPIINQAYLPKSIDDQMQKQTEVALNNPNFVRVQENKVLLSQIFEWYKNDFLRNNSNLIEFVNQFREEPFDLGLEVSYYKYDWSLNDYK